MYITHSIPGTDPHVRCLIKKKTHRQPQIEIHRRGEGGVGGKGKKGRGVGGGSMDGPENGYKLRYVIEMACSRCGEPAAWASDFYWKNVGRLNAGGNSSAAISGGPDGERGRMGSDGDGEGVGCGPTHGRVCRPTLGMLRTRNSQPHRRYVV